MENIKEIIVAISSAIGAVMGGYAGTQLIKYRISLLEKNVEKLLAKTDDIGILENRIKVCEHRLDDLEHSEVHKNEQ